VSTTLTSLKIETVYFPGDGFEAALRYSQTW